MDAAEWRTFRVNATRCDFPFRHDRNVAMCVYVAGGEFEQDCPVSAVPCAACPWRMGPFQCLR